MIRNNPNSLVEAQDRMLKKLDQKMNKAVGFRGDMHIADWQTIDADSGHLLIGYEQTLGGLTSNDVLAFIAKTFEGQVQPVMETAKQHKKIGAIAVVIHRTVPTRKVEDKASMLAVSNTHFLDQQLGDTWEIKSHTDGTKYLARISQDNITDIVAERKRRMTVQASTVTFGNALSAGVPNLNRGDVVRFYDSGTLMEGKVKSVGNEIAIQADTGSYTVAPEAVVEILQVSPETEKNVKSYLADYFADAYGFEDYANKLTEDLS